MTWDKLCLSEHGSDNTTVVVLIPGWTIHLRAGLVDPCGSFQIRIFCDPVRLGQPVHRNMC